MLVGLLLLALCALSHAQTQCPEGYTYDAPSQACYLLSNSHSTYENAVLDCQLLGGTLPIIHNAQVQAAVVHLSYQSDPEYLWYIGLRRVSGSVFIWNDQSSVDYTSWQPNQPANGLGQNCVSNFAQSGQTGWRVGPCTDTLPYICMHIPSVTTTTSPADPNTCPSSNYTTTTGVLLSPGFSSGQNYGNNLNCQYLITVQSSYFIRFTVTAFATESCCDKLTFYNGPTVTTAQQFAAWSGVISPGIQAESSTNVATLTFITDSSVNYAGFSIQYTQTLAILPTTTAPPPPTCPQMNYTGATGAIASPGYPGLYGNEMSCTYIISVVSNMAVRLSFDMFNTEGGYDFLTLYDGVGPLAPQIIQLSGVEPNTTAFTSTQNVMRAVFTSDSTNVCPGFHATWTTVVPPTTPPPPTKYPPTSPSPQCGADFFFDPISTKSYHYDYNLLTFAQARNSCLARGADLVSIHNEQV
uniref:Uncharacterized protein n=1 Tax=Plectus sambesii TaxID=2011161 RepID=A0A914WI89_9BILA